MHRFILLAIFCFSIFSKAQNLSLNQILSLKKSDIAYIEEFLTQKNWNYIESRSPNIETDTMGKIVFAYNKSEGSDRAGSFFTVFYTEYKNRINLQTSYKDKYLEYLNGVKSFGAQLISSFSDDDGLHKIYQGKTTTFWFTTSRGENGNGDLREFWQVFILDNEDFDNNFADSEN